MENGVGVLFVCERNVRVLRRLKAYTPSTTGHWRLTGVAPAHINFRIN